MDLSADPGSQVPSKYVNDCILFVCCKHGAIKWCSEVLYTVWLTCPRVLCELFMKVLTEEEQVQQGAFLWGATPADSQVGLGLSCGLWILMMVQWSRYANLQWSFSPVSAEKSSCMWICNLQLCFAHFFLIYSPCHFILSCTSPSPSLPSLSSTLCHFSSCFYTILPQFFYFWIANVRLGRLLPTSHLCLLLHAPNTTTDDGQCIKHNVNHSF